MLDRARPYGEVCGGAARTYEQDGLAFDSRGVLIGDEPEPPTAPAAPPGVDRMSAEELRTLVEAYGGTYTTRVDAIRFLKGA